MSIIYHPSLVIRKQATPTKCSHFREYYQERGITLYTGPISHPSSTCLLERKAVSGFSSFLRTKCTEIGSTDDRLPFNREGVLYSNTKDARIHGFTFAELILNYQPVPCHYDTAEGPIPAEIAGEIVDTPAHHRDIYTALRDEERLLPSEAATYSHDSTDSQTR